MRKGKRVVQPLGKATMSSALHAYREDRGQLLKSFEQENGIDVNNLAR